MPQVNLQQDEEDTEEHRNWAPVDHIYALGDCCADPDRPLPALAQVGPHRGLLAAQWRRRWRGRGPSSVYASTAAAAAQVVKRQR